jgi:hypothetical protein
MELVNGMKNNGAHFLLRKKPGFPLQSFGCAKRISAAIPCARIAAAQNRFAILSPARTHGKLIIVGAIAPPESLAQWQRQRQRNFNR